MIVSGAVVLLRRDDKGQSVKIDPSARTSTTIRTPSAGTAIWPFESMNRTFATPEEAAKSFAIDYLGMIHARLGKTTKGDVEIFPNDRGNARTVVHVEQQPPRGWVVVGASADQIVVDQPKPGDALANPLLVSGKSVAYEAQVGVELRPFGSRTPVVTDFVMGGATDPRPFNKQIAIPSTDQPLVLILFEGDASGEQAYTKATVIPLDAASTQRGST
jgi:hypothetical protein